jgi:integrase
VYISPTACTATCTPIQARIWAGHGLYPASIIPSGAYVTCELHIPLAQLTRYKVVTPRGGHDIGSGQQVPGRPLLGSGDVPKEVLHLPRYIPDDELERLMEIIRSIQCPYQRTALLVARWSGARRDEIHRLSVDCLDTYPDGTARLRIPAGKTKRERIIPLHEEAADAIRSLQVLRSGNGDRGLRDPLTGVETRYLFVRRGKLLSTGYLFECPLRGIPPSRWTRERLWSTIWRTT